MRRPDRNDDAHTALVGSPLGHTAIAAFVFVMAIWIVGPNLPASPIRDTVDIVWEPAIEIGYDQSWSVFSPNPRDQSIEVVALLEYADGTSATWALPDFDPVVGVYRGYRWLKWQERIRLDDSSRYWDASAAWIADNNRHDGELPQTVRLVRRWTWLSPLTGAGVDPEVDGEFVPNVENEYEFHVWKG